MGNNELYDALASRLGVGREQLAAGTGSVAVLYHLLQAFCEPGDEVVYAWRSFEAYPIAVSATGAVSVQVPVTADGRHDLEAMAARVTARTRAVIVCTPNNPTGPSVSDTDLRELVAQVPDDVLVVVDEAYREFVRIGRPDRRPAAPGCPRQRRGDADLRQGLRAGRAAGRLPRRAPGGGGGGAGLRAAVRCLERRPGGGGRQPRRGGRAVRAGGRDRGRAGPRAGRADRPGLGRSPSRRATSCGCRWGSARRSS